MKAIFFEQHGELDVLKYADLPDPTPAPGEVLVRVRAVALNYLDVWVRRGWPGLKVALPHITGSDIMGEIVSVNAAKSVWTKGARVVINPGHATSEDEWTRRGEESLSPGYQILGEQRCGGMAEYVCVPMASVFRAPEGWSDEACAAPLLVGQTCWRMLFHRANLRPGETVLVVGAGGGVNTLAIQLAKAAGARVIVLAGSPVKAERARLLGADEVIEYRKVTAWSKEVVLLTKGRGVDVVVDNVGEKTLPQSIRACARGGRIVSVGNTSGPLVQFDNRLLFTKQISLLGSTMGSSQDFVDVLNFMIQKNIQIPIDIVAPFKDGIRQLARLEEGEQFGKIVLKVS